MHRQEGLSGRSVVPFRCKNVEHIGVAIFVAGLEVNPHGRGWIISGETIIRKACRM